MRTPYHGFEVAYNAQLAVDARHKLIVAFDLTNEGNDSRQLHPMGNLGQGRTAGQERDGRCGFGSNGEQGSKCEQSGITAIVPRPRAVNKRGGDTLAAMSSPTMQKRTAGVARPAQP